MLDSRWQIILNNTFDFRDCQSYMTSNSVSWLKQDVIGDSFFSQKDSTTSDRILTKVVCEAGMSSLVDPAVETTTVLLLLHQGRHPKVPRSNVDSVDSTSYIRECNIIDRYGR
jgi:hypothetical protein